MAKYKIFHNPRCSKSRKALALLEEKNLNTDIFEYLEAKVSEKVLKDLLSAGNFSALDMVRSKEAKEEGFGAADLKAMSDSELIKFISKNPRVLQRPIVIKDSKKAVIAREDGWLKSL